jgi:hypothetical protein
MLGMHALLGREATPADPLYNSDFGYAFRCWNATAIGHPFKDAHPPLSQEHYVDNV